MADPSSSSPIIDTSVFVDLFKRRAEAEEFIGSRLRSGRLVIHAAVQCELLQGARGRVEVRELDRLFRKARTLFPTEQDWTLALRLCREHTARSGTDWVDCLVAASAVRLGAAVATVNAKHFLPIREVVVERPY